MGKRGNFEKLSSTNITAPDKPNAEIGNDAFDETHESEGREVYLL